MNEIRETQRGSGTCGNTEIQGTITAKLIVMPGLDQSPFVSVYDSLSTATPCIMCKCAAMIAVYQEYRVKILAVPAPLNVDLND